MSSAPANDSAAWLRAIKAADATIARELASEIAEEESATFVTDPDRSDVFWLNAAMEASLASREHAEQLVKDTSTRPAGSDIAWIVPLEQETPDGARAVLEKSGFKQVESELLVMMQPPRPQPLDESDPFSVVGARALLPQYRSYLRATMPSGVDPSQWTAAKIDLLDLDALDVLLIHSTEKGVLASAAIHTAADIGILRSLNILPDVADYDSVRDRLIGAVLEWCSRCQFRRVIAATRMHGVWPDDLCRALALEPVGAFTTWRRQ